MGYISDFSKNQSTGGYYSFTKKNTQLGVDELLAAAQAQGGAVGEVAYELTHPKSSILSTIGTGFKKAFAGFVDIIGTPLNVVAGAISQEKTISQAMEENLTVSEVLFKDRDKRIPQTKLEKVGGFILRTAVDILADPLTYITFGASRGIFGLKSLPSLKITEKTFKSASEIIAKTDGELADLLFKQTGKELSEDALKAEISATRKGASEILRKSKVDDMGQFVGGTMNVSEKGQKMMETYISNKRQGLMSSVTAKEVRETLESNLTKNGVKLSNDAVNKRVLDAMNGLDKVLLSQTADARLSKEFVQETVSNMLGARPALIETWIDKGGIKAFGKTILSGQRIAAVKPFIPGLTMLDEATKGARNVFKSAFSNNYSIHGEKPAGLVSLVQRAKDVVTSTQNSAMEDLIRAGKKFKLDENEMDMIVSALEGGQMPSDPKLAEFWKATQGMDFDKNIVRDEVFQGTRFFQQLRKKNLKMMREAGIPITERQNYFGHILVDNKVKNVAFKPGINKAPSASKFAGISTFIDETGKRELGIAKPIVEDGKTGLIVKFKDAQGDFTREVRLDRINKPALVEDIRQRIDDTIYAKLNSVDELRSEMLSVMDDIKNTFDEKSIQAIDDHISSLGKNVIDNKTKGILLDVIRENIPELNIANIVNKRLNESYKNGIKIQTALKDVSPADISKISKRLSTMGDVNPQTIERFNKIMDDIKAPFESTVKKETKSVTTLEDVAKKLADKKTALKAQVESGIDADKLAKVLSEFKLGFESTAPGISKQLDSIIERKLKISDLLRDIDVERVAGKQELLLADAIKDGSYFDDFSKTTVTRAEATIKEIEKELPDIKFEHNPFKVFALKSIEAIKSSASNEFVRDVSKKYGKLSSEAGEGFVTVKGIKDLDGKFTELQQFLKGTNGEDIMFHPAVAKEIENFMSGVVNDEATDKIMRAFDKMQSYWKSSVTSIFPSFHGRNAISNVFLHYLDLGVHSLNPGNHIRSAKMMFDNHQFSKLQGLISTGKATAKDMDSMYELMNKVVMTDNTGMPWTFGELRSVIQKNVVGFNPNLVGQLDMSKSSREMVEDMVENVFPSGIKDTIKQKANPFKWGRNVGNIVEDQARILSFLTNLEKTGDPIHAAQRTKMFLFDYANLTKFEKGVMRRIIPFYSFTRKNLELQAKTLFSTPGRISAEINAVSSLGDILSNDRLTDEEKNMLPEWLNNGLVTLKSRNGNFVEVLGQLGTPIEAAFGSIQPQGILSSVSPFIKVPVELASGYSFFHGKALSEVTNAAAFKDAPQVVKDFVGFSEVKGKRKDGSEYEYYVSLRPERMHLVLSLPPTARVFSSLKQMSATDVSSQSKILQQLIGVRPFSFDLEVEAARREKELQSKLENILDDANVGYTFSRFSLTKEPKTFK